MKKYVLLFVAAIAVLFLSFETQVAAQAEVAGDANVAVSAEVVPPATVIEPVVSNPGETTDIEVMGIQTSIRSSFWLDEIPFLRDTQFQETPLWQYLAFFIYLVIAYFVARILTAGLFGVLRMWFLKTESVLGRLVLASLRKPTRLIVFVILLCIGLRLYRWPDWISGLLEKAFTLAVAISITFAFAKLVDVLFSFWREKTTADKTFTDQIIPLFNRIVKYIVVFIGLLMMAANLGINVTSVLALGSVGGLAVGLATQDLLNNVFGGIVVFLDKPFHLGDRITVEGKDGIVESIGLRSTRVRALDGSLVTIPNKTICNSLITNITSRPTIKTEVNIGVVYETTAEQLKKAIAIVTEIYKRHPMTHDSVVNFNQFGDFALNIQVIHWHKPSDWAPYMKDMEEMNLEVKKSFDAEGIGFAYPTQTLFVKQDSDWKMAASK